MIHDTSRPSPFALRAHHGSTTNACTAHAPARARAPQRQTCSFYRCQAENAQSCGKRALARLQLVMQKASTACHPSHCARPAECMSVSTCRARCLVEDGSGLGPWRAWESTFGCGEDVQPLRAMDVHAIANHELHLSPLQLGVISRCNPATSDRSCSQSCETIEKACGARSRLSCYRPRWPSSVPSGQPHRSRHSLF